MTEQLRRTKILATLGPATDAPGMLAELISAGVNVVHVPTGLISVMPQPWTTSTPYFS